MGRGIGWERGEERGEEVPGREGRKQSLWASELPGPARSSLALPGTPLSGLSLLMCS